MTCFVDEAKGDILEKYKKRIDAISKNPIKAQIQKMVRKINLKKPRIIEFSLEILVVSVWLNGDVRRVYRFHSDNVITRIRMQNLTCHPA